MHPKWVSSEHCAKKSKKILDRYRDARSFDIPKADDESERIEKFHRLIREKYNRTYHEKQGHMTGSLDYLIMDVLGTSWTDHLIETTYSKMDDLQFNSEDYKNILNMYYFDAKERDDEYIKDVMKMSRPTYYRRKREAITLFGMLLWNTMIEESGCV